jgi:hypothetical protein
MKLVLEALLITACVLVIPGVDVYAKWARLQSGEVQETFVQRPNFHADVMAQIQECPDEVQVKWRRQGNDWVGPETPEEKARKVFNEQRRSLLSLSGIKARKTMADTFVYRLTGSLETGYPDPTAPMCTNGAGVALSLSDFNEYLQDRQDGTATAEELQALRQAAKQARQYLRSLKGD